MGQITIYLEDDILAEVKSVTKLAGLSQSQWIAGAIRARLGSEWSPAVKALAGAWADFPSAEEIRSHSAEDSLRETW